MVGIVVKFNLSLVLLIVAVALFLLAMSPKVARGWMIPLGLACFSGSFLVNRLGA